MPLVWAGGLGMMFLALWMAGSMRQEWHQTWLERSAREFYAAEASGQDPSRTFYELDRDQYRLDILDKYGPAQRILKLKCMTSLIGLPSFCYVNVQRSRSNSYEIIQMRRVSWVMVYEDPHSPLR